MRWMTHTGALLLFLCGAVGEAQTARRAPQRATAAESGVFIVRIGADTIAVEQFTRRPGRLEGKLVIRSPRTAVRTYTATLRPDGTVSRFELTSAPPSAPATQRATMQLRPDSAIVALRYGDSASVTRLATDGVPLPYVNNSYALYEQALIHTRSIGRDSLHFALVPAGAARTLSLMVRQIGSERAVFDNIAGPAHAQLDARGHLVSVDGSGTTQQFVIDRVASFDLDAFAAASAARDAKGQAVGVLSPRDTVNASIAGAQLMIDYGRPGKRGRVVMGHVVPWGQVWRTGANAATQLRTDRDLVIGGAAVPAGMYTLYTLPAEAGWTLIINRQTGQWGTAYDASKDLARVPMRREPLTQPVERFTIAVEPAAGGGTLALVWDDARVTVPVEVR